MTSIPLNSPDRDQLKQNLSLFVVAEKLGIQLDRSGQGLCPFHDDDDPSLYLWEGDDGLQRWWCQPCGFGGDIFDLIQRRTGASFHEALERAQEMLDSLPPGYEPPARTLANRPDPSEWWTDVEASRQRAASQPGILAALSGLAPVEDPRLCQAWDVYLRGTWGWGVSAIGQVYMPHWADGVLTGCKIRASGGAKQSLPGSRYERLYGSWLGRRNPDVLLVEGETDAAYGGWAAAEDSVPIDVFALPSGAMQDVDPVWLDFLGRTRVLYLAFDPDDAGVECTRRWIEALGRSNRFPDVRVCRLPLGKDLRSARPSLQHLLNTAQSPLQEPDDIFTQPGGFARPGRNGNMRVVSTWTIDPVAQLAGGDEPGYVVRLRSQGIESEENIKLSDLATVSSIKRWAQKHRQVFTSNDADLQAISRLVVARGSVTPEIFQSARVGVHDAPTTYRFAGPTILFPDGYIGQLPWRYTPSGRTAANVSGRILLPIRSEQELFSWSWLSAFLDLSTPDVMHPILAWLIAATRRTEIERFPLLFIGGSSGVGKSTLARLATRLTGSQIEVDLGGTTKFVLTTTLAATTSIPVFIDEWTMLSGRDIRLAFKGMIPIIYTGGLSERGQADLSTVPYWMTSPIVVAGEDTFVLTREQERMVTVSPTLRGQNREAYQAIVAKPLERFGAQYFSWLASMPELPPFAHDVGTRVEHNRMCLEVGWRTLHAFLEYAGAQGEDVPPIPLVPDLSCFERELQAREENVYLLALEEGLPLQDQTGLPYVWRDEDDRGIMVRAQALLGELQRRQIDLELPGGSRAMLNYFREAYDVSEEHVHFGLPINKRVRAHLIAGLSLGEKEVQSDDESPAG